MLRKTPTVEKAFHGEEALGFQATETTAAAVPQGKMTLAEVSDTLQQLKWLQGIDARNLLMLSQKVYANQPQCPDLVESVLRVKLATGCSSWRVAQ